TDQARAALLEPDQRAVIMPLAAAEARPAMVDGNQGDQHEVGLDQRMTLRRLHHAERAGLQRVAGEEAERFSGIGEAGIADDCADRARFLHRWQRTDLAPERAIAANDGNPGELRCEPL